MKFILRHLSLEAIPGRNSCTIGENKWILLDKVDIFSTKSCYPISLPAIVQLKDLKVPGNLGVTDGITAVVGQGQGLQDFEELTQTYSPRPHSSSTY